MNVPSAGSVVKFRSWHWGDEVAHWSFWHLISRRKIKKKNKTDFVYKAEVFEWKRSLNRYQVDTRYITIHTIRALFQNKRPNSEARIIDDADWEVFLAKNLLSE